MAESYDDLRRGLGQRIRALRVARTLSQAQCCAASGLSIDTWSRIERGASPNPTLSTLHEMTAVLGVEIADLFPVGGRDDGSITSMFDVLDEESRQAIEVVLRRMSGIK